ncbi:MAG: tRNA 2-selenouridine(34) synthase MnmH [Burkholderiales bacterium]
MEHSRDVTVAQVDDFDEIVDVRTPAEFALDHIPGAINCPVLSDDERARVGTMYKQVSAFAAKRSGAALVARNIAHMLETRLHDRPPGWSPLVYCWRGGGRSDALCEVLRRVGWRAARLQGGYQAYRRSVVAVLEQLPQAYDYRVLCGRTGSGKSQVLEALASLGAQVLDLEGLASHRGSVLGDVPGHPQPTQKMFESLLWQRLRELDRSRPVFVEAESRKVGNVQVPGALIAAMRAAPCALVQAPTPVRTALLMKHYAHFLEQDALLSKRLHALTSHYGRATIERWCALAQAGRHPELVAELLEQHYDPAYDRSITRNFVHVCEAQTYRLDVASAPAIRAVAEQIFAQCAHEQPA